MNPSSPPWQIQRWDEDNAMEEMARAELTDLPKQSARLDPLAYSEVGNHLMTSSMSHLTVGGFM